MAFAAKVILDSIPWNSDHRLITVQATWPRFIHSEVLTHRDRERNSASSRAIPWISFRPRFEHETPGEYAVNKAEMPWSLDQLSDKCMKAMILRDPVVPMTFGREQRGMQQGAALEGEEDKKAREIWLAARDMAVAAAESLAELGVHKSICNRLTEPFMWITVVMTATEWNNFFRLRCHPAAEQHFQHVACMIREAIRLSTPTVLNPGEWHLPYVRTEDDEYSEAFRYVKERGVNIRAINLLKMVSTARCARTSYLTQDGRRDFDADLKLYNTLLKPPGDPDEDIMHASPFGHVAVPAGDPEHRSGPFIGWVQHRKEFSNENVPGCL